MMETGQESRHWDKPPFHHTLTPRPWTGPLGVGCTYQKRNNKHQLGDPRAHSRSRNALHAYTSVCWRTCKYVSVHRDSQTANLKSWRRGCGSATEHCTECMRPWVQCSAPKERGEEWTRGWGAWEDCLPHQQRLPDHSTEVGPVLILSSTSYSY